MAYNLVDGKRHAPVTPALLLLNVVCFFWVELHGSSENTENMIRWGALYGPLVFQNQEYWRFLTAAFLHFGIGHLANNMLIFFLLGDNLERALGHVKYLVFYLLCAVGSNIFSLFMGLEDMEYTVGAGASGAIYGVIGGLLWALIRNRGRLEDLSTGQIAFFVLLSLYYGFSDSGVDNSAHIGGLLIGFLLSILMYRVRKKRNNRNEDWDAADVDGERW